VSEFLLKAAEWEQVTPESAGWRYLFFGVRNGSFSSETGDAEVALVPLSGNCRVEADGQPWELGGRDSVFDGMPWALYLPRDTVYRVEGDAEIAICGARCERRREPVLVTPEEVEIEVRDGDLMLVPYGYHTTATAHGYDLYYLNALGGDRRSMAAADDPDLAWIRRAWADLEPDPRVPLVR
jgi:5-deoxy-D-glucuronate isomerase